MIGYYILYFLFTITWILGIYYLFNRKKLLSRTKEKPASEFDIIARPDESKIRIIFDQNNPNNLDIKSLADLTVKYSDLISGNYTLSKEKPVEKEISVPEKLLELDLSEYINIFSIKKQDR